MTGDSYKQTEQVLKDIDRELRDSGVELTPQKEKKLKSASEKRRAQRATCQVQ